MSDKRRHWLTNNELDLKTRLAAENRARQEAHLAKHGPHTCTPDPNDPWSVCHLDSVEVAK